MENETKYIDLNKLEPKVKKKRHSVKHSKDNALNPEQQKDLITTVSILGVKEETKYKYEVMIHLLMNGGLRIGEAIQVRLDWFGVTDDRIVLNIPSKARDLSNLKRDWVPKTAAGAREIIFINKGVGEKIRSFFISNKGLNFNRQRAYQIVKQLGFKAKHPIGSNVKCQACDKETKIESDFKYMDPLKCKYCKVIIAQSKLHPHALRSTYANNLVHAGVNANALCYAMGWSDMNTAINYIQTSKVHARDEIINKMGGQD